MKVKSSKAPRTHGIYKMLFFQFILPSIETTEQAVFDKQKLKQILLIKVRNCYVLKFYDWYVCVSLPIQ